MAHLRKQIRDNVVTALTGLSTTGSRVYASRVYPNLPGLCVYTKSESVEILTMLFFGALLLFVMLGTPLAFALGGISVIFLYAEMGDLGFYLLASKMWETMQSPTLMAIPLFVFMAILLEKSGVANDLYDMMHEWWGGLRGGLAIGTVLICVIFAATEGHLDTIEVGRLRRWERGFHDFLGAQHGGVLSGIREGGVLTEEITADLVSAIEEYNENFAAEVKAEEPAEGATAGASS